MTKRLPTLVDYKKDIPKGGLLNPGLRKNTKGPDFSSLKRKLFRGPKRK
jgi:hypothetical protein